MSCIANIQKTIAGALTGSKPAGNKQENRHENRHENKSKPSPFHYPFHDPNPLRISDWDTELVSEDAMYFPIPGQKDVPVKSLDTLIHEGRVPVLCFTATLYREIRHMVERNANSELAMFLTLKRLHAHKPVFLAFDFFMPGQEASGGGVSLDADDCRKYFDALGEVPYYKENGLHRHLCHLHSHGRNGIFWSGIDDEQQFSRDDLGYMDDYRFYVVVNADGGIKCSLVTYTPVLARVDAAVALACNRPEYVEWLSRSRKKELDDLVGEMVRDTVARGMMATLERDPYGDACGDFLRDGLNLPGRGKGSPLGTSAAGGSLKSWNGVCGLHRPAPVFHTQEKKPEGEATANLAELVNFLQDIGIGEDVDLDASDPFYLTVGGYFMRELHEGSASRYEQDKMGELFNITMWLLGLDGGWAKRAGDQDLNDENKLRFLGTTLAKYMRNVSRLYGAGELDAVPDSREDSQKDSQDDLNDPTIPSPSVSALLAFPDDCLESYQEPEDYANDVINALCNDIIYIVCKAIDLGNSHEIRKQ